MSLNRLDRNRAQYTTDSRTYKILTTIDSDPYWDEGVSFLPRYRVGFKNSNKKLQSYQIRMYKTWKHNRKKQWKNF